MSDDNPGTTGTEGPDDARIRALLGELGSGPDGEPMPPEVSARLDATLARLVAERGEQARPTVEQANVVPLRRRWASRATAAAAAVIVVAAGGVAAASLGVFDGSTSDSSSTAGGSSAADSSPKSGVPSSPGPEALSGEARSGNDAVPQVSSASFASDAEALVKEGRLALVQPGSSGRRRSNGAGSGSAGESGGQPGGQPGGQTDQATAVPCPGPVITDGSTASPVTYDGRRAVLVVHPASAGRQQVEAWSCSGSRRLDEATITP